MRKVRRISGMHTWDRVELADAEAFARGCGFHLGQHAAILRKVEQVAERGLLSLTHLQYRGQFYQRGAQSNLLKFITKTLQ